LAAVFLIRGHVSDAGVESHLVVVGPSDLKFGSEHIDVVDQLEVGMFAFEVPEERFDPRLVGGSAGTAVVGSQPAQRHELSGAARGHLGTVVRHHQQDRQPVVVGVIGDRPVGAAFLDLFEESFDSDPTLTVFCLLGWGAGL
jgi:hypothetical protein